MVSTLVIGVDEVWLKGANRRRYLAHLRYNIQETLRAFHPTYLQIESEGPLFWVTSHQEFSPATLAAVCKVPGVHGVEVAYKIDEISAERTPLTLDERLQIMGKFLIELGDDLLGKATTFKVDTRRSYKQFPGTSHLISRRLGAMVVQAYPHLRVDLERPSRVARVRIMKRGVFISLRQLKGVGGLPLGTSGHLLCLLSGGMDSPVASYLLATRGSRQTFVFFYAYPFVSHEAKDKVMELVKVLSLYQNVGNLVVVPFAEVQNRIAETAEMSYRTVFFRRYMIRCANMLAQALGAQGLIMGDSLGQVSSQTLENMSALDHDSALLILRPLVGLNKEAIIRYAEQIGTFPISKIPHQDACQLFAPQHPVTKVDLDYWRAYEESQDWNVVLQRALAQREHYTITKTGVIARAPHLEG